LPIPGNILFSKLWGSGMANWATDKYTNSWIASTWTSHVTD